MNKQDELLGTLVLIDPSLVHPFRDFDNKIGAISFFPTTQDIVLVDFDNGCAGFPIESLLILRDRAKIRRDAGHDFSFLAHDDYENILKVADLVSCGEKEDYKLAIQLAQKNATIMAYTMHSAQQELDLRRNQFIDR